MKKIKLTAKFKGGNSLGYQHGKTYDIFIDSKNGMSITRTDGSGICVYNSLSAFFNNWTL